MGMNLRGKAALVTGGSRGLGEALGEALATRGAKVVLVARDAGPLAEVAVRIRERRPVPPREARASDD